MCIFLDSNYIEYVNILNIIFILADPGKSVIFYCGSKNDDGKLETLKYTQNQQILELGINKYRNIIHKQRLMTKQLNRLNLY